MPTTQEKLTAIIVQQLDVEPQQITPEAAFVDDLGADSLDIMEMVMSMEEAFGIDIPDEDADSIRTVGQALKYIDEHSGA